MPPLAPGVVLKVSGYVPLSVTAGVPAILQTVMYSSLKPVPEVVVVPPDDMEQDVWAAPPKVIWPLDGKLPEAMLMIG